MTKQSTYFMTIYNIFRCKICDIFQEIKTTYDETISYFSPIRSLNEFTFPTIGEKFVN